MNEERPKKLYRGIVLDYKTLKQVTISGMDMYPPYEAKTNAEGRKVVGDGNEYGVYMSDYEQMVLAVYSNPKDRGMIIDSKIRVGIHEEFISIPNVGIAYEIDTNGLNIREPWIRPELKGHHNNGFVGKEWIADSIPSDKYKIIRVQIGNDLLHDLETLDLSKTSDIKQELIDKVETRKARLEVFKDDMSKLDSSQRRNISRDMLDLLKLFYGENGARYLATDEIDVSTPEGAMKRILKESLYNDDGKIDLDMLGRYGKLWSNFNRLDKESQNIEGLRTIFEEELKKAELSKNKFIEMRKLDGKEYTTSNFDKRIRGLAAAVGVFDANSPNQGNNLRESAIEAGINVGLRDGMLVDTQKIIEPSKEENIKTV